MILNPYSWIEIDREALLHNVAAFKSCIGNNAILAPVIKSNAYGHGLTVVAQILDTSKEVDFFCVGYLSEALRLRESGIQKQLLVMSCIDDDPQKARGMNIHFIVGDMQKLSTLSEVGKKIAYDFNIHLKIDTGLSRFGVMPNDAIVFVHKIRKIRGVNLVGLCTHFAESYKEDSSFTQQQLQIFVSIIRSLEDIPLYIHTSNTAGTFTTENPYVNMFRIGLGVYGYWPSHFVHHKAQIRKKNMTLKPVLSFKTRIMEIKVVKKGMYVGYDRTFTAQRETVVALLPVGYYDGYDFRLCNNSLVYINDKPFPLIGKVAMNVLMIDITDDPSLLVGTEVLLLGDKQGITAHDFGERIGEPNPRKIVTCLGAHLPRIVI